MVHKYKDVIIAWANGEQIQFAWKDIPDDYNDFRSEYTPHFNHPDLIWRIKPKKTYCIGNKFKEYYDSNIYLLASTEDNHVCALINIITGYRLNTGIKVNDAFNITEEEFNKISLGQRMIPVEMSAVSYEEI